MAVVGLDSFLIDSVAQLLLVLDYSRDVLH